MTFLSASHDVKLLITAGFGCNKWLIILPAAYCSYVHYCVRSAEISYPEPTRLSIGNHKKIGMSHLNSWVVHHFE